MQVFGNWFPRMCKRGTHLPLTPLAAFASITILKRIPLNSLCIQENSVFWHLARPRRILLSKSLTAEKQASRQAGFQLVASLLDALDRPRLVTDRRGQLLFTNTHAEDALQARGLDAKPELDLFQDILHADRREILSQLESGKQEVNLPLESPGGNTRARVRWLPEPDWLAVFIEPAPEEPSAEETEMRQKVQELIQEREITYRNLLAAYLRLQEANRQKTVFLASAAHELKTPLAVMKGYYELLLSGSLGKVSEKQRDILRESKESCDRLVRLVSMFLNYSALESGKLVLQFHENDLRDCINDLTCRWQDAFQRAKIHLDVKVHPDLPVFKFDYQKVQQCIANLLDNALKHTPTGGTISLLAKSYFWERRISEASPSAERRRDFGGKPNSVLLSVRDTGSGIAA